ncbi:MAG: hypothetical protein RL021_832 [Bacteroidota bacterium]
MRKIIRDTGPVRVSRRPDVCLYLCKSIVSQQLSTKVAAVIERRLSDLLPPGASTAEAILSIPDQKLRSIGLSAAKSSYLHNVARFFSELTITDATFRNMEDESVIELLTGIKGVGRWTAEMTLLFSLGRKDVFSTGDYGIQQSFASAYRLPATDRKRLVASMEELSKAWSPYRSYACLHLWRYRDLGS